MGIIGPMIKKINYIKSQLIKLLVEELKIIYLH